MQGKYEKRGVSARKEEVHRAIRNLDKGLYPNAFCKVLPDIRGDSEYCSVMHADTAGTKTSLAYLYWKETGDLSVWKGIAQDAIVMNLDDLGCTGITRDIILSNTIGRNKNHIPGEVIRALIEGTVEFIDKLNTFGLNIQLAGGETADVGDIVRTVDMGFTAYSRIPGKKILENNIGDGDLIVGLASFGNTVYEEKYNSGIGSNGLTFARHEVLSKEYARKYPESFDPALDKNVVYTGNAKLPDPLPGAETDVGRSLLSSTRSYLPFLDALFSRYRENIHGIIHNTGGGQTKVLNFIDGLEVIKDSLFEPPPVFTFIQKQKQTGWKEMYQVFNMGTRLEIYLEESQARKVIDLAGEFDIDAQVIGRCRESDNKKVTLETSSGTFEYV